MTPNDLKQGIEGVTAMLQGDPSGDEAVAEAFSTLVIDDVKDFVSNDDAADLAVVHAVRGALENPRMVAFLVNVIKKCTDKLEAE